MPEVLARFRGPVQCERSVSAPQLTLRGKADGVPLALAFSASAPPQLPPTLADALVESLGDGQYRLRSGAAEWTLAARAVHRHEDVRAAFYRAIPPRPAPLKRRLFFRMVLTLAASRGGLALLKALRR
jgi:hypothetical protein